MNFYCTAYTTYGPPTHLPKIEIMGALKETNFVKSYKSQVLEGKGAIVTPAPTGKIPTFAHPISAKSATRNFYSGLHRRS